jgi:hypothetical protein
MESKTAEFENVKQLFQYGHDDTQKYSELANKSEADRWKAKAREPGNG